jgi:hypothetical protein
VRQPDAELILRAEKNIEDRNRPTKLRERVSVSLRRKEAWRGRGVRGHQSTARRAVHRCAGRDTEQLKHEKYLSLAKSDPYRDIEGEEALKRLAERVEEQVSIEHAKWMSELSRQAGQRGEQGEK